MAALDGSDKKLFAYLPYILQDIWEIGVDPDTIIRMVCNHFENYIDLKVLDLGCGKGAVTVKLSQNLGCTCHGIDAVPEFVEFAQKKANELKLNLCTFETGDIREVAKDFSGYNIVILGAIGPVFGDYFATLSTLAKCINEDGIFIIDDGYIVDNSDFSHPLMFKKSAILRQIEEAGMQLDEIYIMDSDVKILTIISLIILKKDSTS